MPSNKVRHQVIGIVGVGVLLSILFGVFRPSRIPVDDKDEHSAAIRNTAALSDASAPPETYFLSRDDYNDFQSTFLLLLAKASQGTPVPDDDPPANIPETLKQKTPETQHRYVELLEEKNRWDRYLEEQYRTVLDRHIEPVVFDVEDLSLNDARNLDLFTELSEALALHKRLIRDVRIFHDEVRFQAMQPDEPPYRLYDLKLKLGPFARESAIADAMQQAMSALSVGIYPQQAAAVIDRLCQEFTRPVRQLYGQLQHADENRGSIEYNYNIYVVYGQKMAAYSDRLKAQSSVHLISQAIGELDYLNRQLFQSFFDLHQIGQHPAMPPTHLDVEVLERHLNTQGIDPYEQ